MISYSVPQQVSHNQGEEFVSSTFVVLKRDRSDEQTALTTVKCRHTALRKIRTSVRMNFTFHTQFDRLKTRVRNTTSVASSVRFIPRLSDRQKSTKFQETTAKLHDEINRMLTQQASRISRRKMGIRFIRW